MLNEFLSVSKKVFRSSFIVMSYDSLLQTIGLLSTAIFLWVGANQVMSGSLSIGGFVAFSSLTAMAYGGIMRTLGVWDNLQFASVLMNRLNDIFEQEPEQGRDRSRLTPVHSLEGHIELRGVSFKYGGPESPDILNRHHTRPGTWPSGGICWPKRLWKNDIIKLIAGLLEPAEGTILFDHVDLKDIELSRRAPADRNGLAGKSHVQRDDRAQYLLRRFGTRSRSRIDCGADGERARFHHASATRLRDEDRRVGPFLLGWTKATDRDRARDLQQSAGSHFR